MFCVNHFEEYILWQSMYLSREHCVQTEIYIATSFVIHSLVCILVTQFTCITCRIHLATVFLVVGSGALEGSRWYCAVLTAGLSHWHGRWRSIFEMMNNVNYTKVKSRLTM